VRYGGRLHALASDDGLPKFERLAAALDPACGLHQVSGRDVHRVKKLAGVEALPALGLDAQ
jgi:hypothetical protein